MQILVHVLGLAHCSESFYAHALGLFEQQEVVLLTQEFEKIPFKVFCLSANTKGQNLDVRVHYINEDFCPAMRCLSVTQMNAVNDSTIVKVLEDVGLDLQMVGSWVANGATENGSQPHEIDFWSQLAFGRNPPFL